MTAEVKAGRFALAFIFLTMLIDTIGLGIIIPVSPGLIAELDALKTSHEQSPD